MGQSDRKGAETYSADEIQESQTNKRTSLQIAFCAYDNVYVHVVHAETYYKMPQVR